MYRVISICDDEMTRIVKLENTITGTIDECFDDSALISGENFDFLMLENMYNCKIKLFGNVSNEMQDEAVLCKIICKNAVVGTKNMVQVLVENDEYYIPVKKVAHISDINYFYFKYTRKDLIQVNEIIHADFL